MQRCVADLFYVIIFEISLSKEEQKNIKFLVEIERNHVIKGLGWFMIYELINFNI